MKQLFSYKGFFAYIAMIFLNAFIDLGHKIVIQNTIFKMYDGDIQIMLTALVNGLLLLPFIMLFTPAGFVSDKFSKPQVMRKSAVLAIVATSLITLCYWQGWFVFAFVLTFVMGIQSAFYSPAKYGYLKELIGVKKLALGNGMVQAITIVSILLGTIVFSAFFEFLLVDVKLDSPGVILQSVLALGWVFVALSVIEYIFSRQLVEAKTPDRDKEFIVKKYLSGQYLKANFSIIFEKRPIWLSIIGLSMFWSVSQVVLATFPAFAKDVLSMNNTLVIQGILGATGIGIVLGSILAGRISKNHIELGLIPISAIGFALLLGYIASLTSVPMMVLVFLGIGITGGLFIVPLNALMQYNAKENELGTVLAGNNLIQNTAMLSFLVVTIALVHLGISNTDIFTLLMVIALLGAAYTVYQLPHSLITIVAALVLKRRYKVDVLGFENLPENEGLLLLGNHISWIDGILLQMVTPRKVRFVMLRTHYNLWYLKPLMKFFGCIPISSSNSKESLRLVNQALKNGDVVCLFPEGAISRTGSLGVFRTGYERVVNNEDGSVIEGKIVPFYLHGLWGSRLSRAHSKKLRKNTHRGLRRNISVTFGQALPMDTPAAKLKQKVFELSYQAWQHQTAHAGSLPLCWLQSALAQASDVSVIDSNGQKFTNRKLVAVTTAFARKIAQLDNSQNIGLVLPASSAGVIANMAVLLKGKTTVNLNYTTSVTAVQSGIENAQIKTVLTSEKFVKRLMAKGINVEAMLQGINVVYLEQLKNQISKVTFVTAYLATYLLPAKAFYALWGKRVDINSTAAILFSSGSEGTPKGVMLSHANFIANIRQISDVLRTQEDEVVMGSLPPFHSFGLTVTTFLPLVEGVPVICHPDPTDVVNIAKAVSKYNATFLCATATFLRLYTRNKKVQPLMLESLRTIVAGAEKLPVQVRQDFKDKFNKEVFEGYGTTETTPVASVNMRDQLDQSNWRVQVGNKAGTVGMPVPGGAFRIVDPVTMENLGTDQDGLILISGNQVMLGYLNSPEQTANVLIKLDGRPWYKTGDKGHLDADGFLTIVDRYSRFAKIGGEMISLSAVEQCIEESLTHEFIKDETTQKVECLTVNLPDEKKGEKIVLLCNVVITLKQLKQAMLAGDANPLMVPSSVFHLEQLPKLGSGKSDFASAKKLALSLCQTD